MPPVWVDRARVLQILINVIENAVRHTPNDGSVTISMGLDGENVTVSVLDEGPGVSEAQQNSIFDKFVRLDPAPSYRGLGLGLFLARSLAGMHGGALRSEEHTSELQSRLHLRMPSSA